MLNKTVYLEQGEAAKASQFVVYKKGEPAEKLAVETYNPYARETEYFAECVKANQEMKMVPDEDVVNVLRILEAIQKSLETGNLVKTEW